jgi:acetyl-CoA acetyltransferase
VIVSALRTPIGTARKATLPDTTAFELADHVVRAIDEGRTGGRMLATLIYQLRRQGGGPGVAAMCAGGMGATIVIEVPAPVTEKVDKTR